MADKKKQVAEIDWEDVDPTQPLHDEIIGAALRVNPEKIKEREAEALKARKKQDDPKK